MFSRSKLFLYLALIFLYSCANIVAPQGGAKDIIAPKIISLFPFDSAVHFNQNKVVIKFNEDITLKDPEKNITISPRLKKGIKSEAVKNKLILQFNDLQPNTTYTIKAQNCIADLTEGNTIKSFNYVFSTGDSIDTKSIQGKTVNSSNLQILSGIQILLYQDYNDSALLLKDPKYITTSDETGIFHLDNIAKGNYQLVAINDKNTNLKWEPGEEVAFQPNSISTDDLKDNYIIRLFNQGNAINYLISAESPQEGVYKFTWNNNEDVVIHQEDPGMNKTNPYYQMTNFNRCGIRDKTNFIISSYLPDDSAHFNYEINKELLHTAIKTSKQKSKLIPSKFTYNFHNKDSCIIAFQRKLDTQHTDISKISLTLDSQQIDFKNILNIRDNKLIFKSLNKGNYKLLLSKDILSDIYGITNDSIVLSLNVIDAEDQQTLTLHLDSSFKKTYLLTLKNEDYCFQKEVTLKETITLKYLIPGSYTLSISEIQNRTSIEANIFKGISPLKIVLYKDYLIKKDFDIEETIGILYN